MGKRQQTDIKTLFEPNKLVKVCAPMVRYSKLQFRNLVKKYDCDLVFTPMILADSFCKSAKARSNEFTTNLLDTPLVAQFAANTIHDFVGASYLISPYCDGVDLNCGCPQGWAREQELGCQMLRNPQSIYALIRECRNQICKPFSVSVKMRLLKDLKKSVEICRQLERCGASFLSVHARTPECSVGPIDKHGLRAVVESVEIPVIGNGGVGSLENCIELQECAKVAGVMVANGILANPTLFSGTNVTPMRCVQDWLDICYNSTLGVQEYEKLCGSEQLSGGIISERPFNLTFQCFHHHLVFMLEKVLNRKQKRIFNNLKSFADVQSFLESSFSIKSRLFNREDFLKSVLLDSDYASRDVVYRDLLPPVNDAHINGFYHNINYNGKYFTDKISNECDWSAIFIENG